MTVVTLPRRLSRLVTGSPRRAALLLALSIAVSLSAGSIPGRVRIGLVASLASRLTAEHTHTASIASHSCQPKSVRLVACMHGDMVVKPR